MSGEQDNEQFHVRKLPDNTFVVSKRVGNRSAERLTQLSWQSLINLYDALEKTIYGRPRK